MTLYKKTLLKALANRLAAFALCIYLMVFVFPVKDDESTFIMALFNIMTIAFAIAQIVRITQYLAMGEEELIEFWNEEWR
jgi:hypothetical protein